MLEISLKLNNAVVYHYYLLVNIKFSYCQHSHCAYKSLNTESLDQ